MNIRELQYLVAVAQHQHFGKAARACFVSQPTLSTQLKKLEDELGIQLFERNNKQVLITGPGQMIAAKAKQILFEIHQLKEQAQLAADPLAGPFKLGVIPTLGPYVLPHIMPAISTSLPKLELLLIEDKTEEILRQLHRGELDAIMLATPITDGALSQAALFDEPFYVALPKQHALVQKEKIEMDDLNNEVLLLLAEGHCLADQTVDICTKVSYQEKAGFRATSLETLRFMVASGSGITLLPALATQFNTNVEVAIKPFRGPMPTRHIILVWRKQSARQMCCEALHELIASVITSQLAKTYD